MFQGVEPVLPERLVVGDPVGGGAHGSGHEAAVVHAPFATAGEQAGALEDAEVLRDRRQRHAERARELRNRSVGRLASLIAHHAGERRDVLQPELQIEHVLVKESLDVEEANGRDYDAIRIILDLY